MRNHFLLFVFIISIFSSCKQPTTATVDCGGCGLKESGKKYAKLKKAQKNKK